MFKNNDNFQEEIIIAQYENCNFDYYYSYILYRFLNPYITYKDYCDMFDLYPNNTLKL